MRLLLDSTFFIDHLRGDRAAISRFDDIFEHGDHPFVNQIVVCEVRSGLRPPDEAAFHALLSPLEFVQPAMEHALSAGRWRADARGRGFSLSLADTLVAAAADSVGAAVLTRNLRDFAQLPVTIETY